MEEHGVDLRALQLPAVIFISYHRSFHLGIPACLGVERGRPDSFDPPTSQRCIRQLSLLEGHLFSHTLADKLKVVAFISLLPFPLYTRTGSALEEEGEARRPLRLPAVGLGPPDSPLHVVVDDQLPSQGDVCKRKQIQSCQRKKTKKKRAKRSETLDRSIRTSEDGCGPVVDFGAVEDPQADVAEVLAGGDQEGEVRACSRAEG